MKTDIYIRLSLMMFLQYFVWGAWYVTVGIYMAEIGMGDSIYWAYTVGPIVALISPFFLGMVADRFFATEKVLGTLHLIGGIFMLCAPRVAATGSVVLFILMLLMHMLCYTPTMGLTNTLTFHQVTNQEKQFPVIRVFGTIGWIVAGILISKLDAEATPIPLWIAGGGGLLLGLFSFTLPHTPPPAAGKSVSAREVLGIDAFRELSGKSFNVFLACSLLICIPLAAYYTYAGNFVDELKIDEPAFKMTFGQMSETFFLFVMPFFFVRLGFKWMMLVGMFAWALRYVLFAYAAADATLWMIMTAIILHGICYDFFFVTGQIYVDRKSTPEIRGQAQGLLVMAMFGFGSLIGAVATGIWFNHTIDLESEAAQPWYTFWMAPAIFAAVVMVIFAIFFNNDVKSEAKGE